MTACDVLNLVISAVSHKSHIVTQLRPISLLYIQQTVRSSRTPRADQRSHVECAVGINVMRVDGKRDILQSKVRFEIIFVCYKLRRYTIIN